MKTNWQTKKLGEVCDVIAGQSPEGKFYNKTANGLPFYQGKKEFTNKFIGSPTTWTTKITKEALKDDILMSVRAPIGPINFATQKICIGRGLAAIRRGKFIDINFLFYFLKNFESKIVGNHGAVFNSINKKQIEQIRVPLPPLPEQKRIVKILDGAFENLEIARKNAKKNLANAKELFGSYLQSVFENPGEDWEEKKLGEVASIEKIKNIKTGLPYVGMEDIESNTAKFIGLLKPKKVKSSSFYFSSDHILYGRLRPYLNKILLPNFEGHCSTEIFPIKPTERIIKQFLFYWFFKQSTVEEINATCTGTRMPRANMKKVFENFIIQFPKSLKIQKQIVKKLDELSAQTKKLEVAYQQKIDDLEELKKSILKKAFSGEL